VTIPRSLVVVPTLGRRLEYLAETLESILVQDAPHDLVVVAPVAAEEARALATSQGARLVDDPGGLSAAVNAGIATAGPDHMYANWIGDDDRLAPGALALAAGLLSEHDGVSLVYGHCQYIDPSGRPLWTSRAGRWADLALPWGPNLIPQPGMLFRTTDFRAVGGLDESLQYAMDLDLLLRLRRRGRLVDLGVPVSSFRWHPDSLTVSSRRASLLESEAVKRRYLPPAARRVALLWERPTRWATHLAAEVVTRRARRLATN
jgi:GT2 family glycosyltransferase